MAKSYQKANAKKTLTKEELRLREQRRARKARRQMLAERHNVAVSNMKERQARLYGNYDDDYVSDSRSSKRQRDVAPASTDTIDRQFIHDMARVKFCRKPVGFLMSLLFVVVIAIIGLSFINLNVPALNTFTALYQETEPKKVVDENTDNEGGENLEGEENTEEEGVEEAANASTDEEATDEGTDEEGEGEEEATDGEDGEESSEASGTYYSISDPVFGWISFVAGKLGLSLELGASPWYDMQISKIEAGMNDGLAAILIQVFPAAILLYAIFALSLFIKTFICWASNDRRIYRRTGIECIIMVILALVIILGGFAGTVEIDGTLEFGGIVNFLLGGVTGAGGFTAGYGALILLIIPLVAFILSFFLLERKLRDRDVIQPIIFYDAR